MRSCCTLMAQMRRPCWSARTAVEDGVRNRSVLSGCHDQVDRGVIESHFTKVTRVADLHDFLYKDHLSFDGTLI